MWLNILLVEQAVALIVEAPCYKPDVAVSISGEVTGFLQFA
jgi:hypothetical protein